MTDIGRDKWSSGAGSARLVLLETLGAGTFLRSCAGCAGFPAGDDAGADFCGSAGRVCSDGCCCSFCAARLRCSASRRSNAAGSIMRAASRKRASFAYQAARRKSFTWTAPASTSLPSGRFKRRNGQAIKRASSGDIVTSARRCVVSRITWEALRTSSLRASCTAHNKSWRVSRFSSNSAPNVRFFSPRAANGHSTARASRAA